MEGGCNTCNLDRGRCTTVLPVFLFVLLSLQSINCTYLLLFLVQYAIIVQLLYHYSLLLSQSVSQSVSGEDTNLFVPGVINIIRGCATKIACAQNHRIRIFFDFRCSSNIGFSTQKLNNAPKNN